MNDPASGFFGLVILIASAWLFWLGAGPAPEDTAMKDREFWNARRQRRHWVSAMLAAVGICALGAGHYGRGHAWLILWAVTPVFLLAVIALACLDAFLTRQHFQQRIRQIAKNASRDVQREIKREVPPTP